MVGNMLKMLIEQAADTERLLAQAESVAQDLRDSLAKIYEDDIPTLLHSEGLLAAPLEDGRTVVIDQVCNVKVANREALDAWLAEHEYDAVIKTSLEFPKGSDTSAAESLLKESGVDYTKETFVHPMTLKKVMKDHIGSGGEYPPEDAAVVNIFERAKVKGGKSGE